jgi:hypothetical protein
MIAHNVRTICYLGRPLADIGTQLYILVATSLLGAIITWLFRIDTTGVSLEQIGSLRHS